MKRIVALWIVAWVAGVAGADTFTSITNGLWHLPGTWDPSGIPQEADDAVVTNAVSLNQDAHVEMLSVPSGVLDAAGHALLADASADLYGTGILRNGTFNLSTFNLSGGTVGGGTVNANVFNWTGGRVEGGTHLDVVDGTFPPSGVILYLADSSLRVTGTFAQGGTGMIRLDGTSSVATNQGSWNLGTDAQPFNGTGFFVNEGTFRKSGGTGINAILVPFSDRGGTVQVDGGALRFHMADENNLVFSNTAFAVASGSSVLVRERATFEGAITGSGAGALVLGEYYGSRFYFTNSCSLDLGSAMLRWDTGRFLGDVTTLSPLVVQSEESHSVQGGHWTATGGVRHNSGKDVRLDHAILEIPANATYDHQTDGTLISGPVPSRVDLAGTLLKSGGAGTSLVSAPVYCDGGLLEIAEGTLSFTGNGRMENLRVHLADGTAWSPGGINSNVTVSASGSANIPFNEDAVAAGVWSLTNANLSAWFYFSSGTLYPSPSLTLEGSNSVFKLSKGYLRDGTITNRISFEVTSGGDGCGLSYCRFYNEAEADFFRAPYFSYSTWHNQGGARHRIHQDGKFISGSSSACTYFNNGTFRKVAGSGMAYTGIRWVDEGGTLQVDEGGLSLYAENNQFSGTHIELASGTAFRMAGTLATNITVTAAGPARLRLADSCDQSGLGDLPLSGPITVELVENHLSMTGTISGAEAAFEWTSGAIENSRMTNAVPCLFNGTAYHSLWESRMTLQSGAIHSNATLTLYHTIIRNEAGSLYQLVADGIAMKSSSYGDFHNRGALVKTAGDGTTEINAIFQNQGGVVGAERGLLQFVSAVDLSGGGLRVALGGTNDYGRVRSLDTATADGTLEVTLRDGFRPAPGDRFEVLSGNSLDGAFSSNSLPALASGLEWRLDQSASALTLCVVSSADTDSDGLGDSWELRSFGDLATSGGGTNNVDRDPCTDYQEYIADTLGNDSNDWFRIVAFTNATLAFDSSSNRVYSLYGCGNLVSNAWNLLQGPRPGTGGADSMNPAGNLPAGFYKLEVGLP